MKALYDLLRNKDERKKFDTQFNKAKSNFKIAIVVDMWLAGFDEPFLNTIYIDKPVQRHNLIRTNSRVNRKFDKKKKGLVVDDKAKYTDWSQRDDIKAELKVDLIILLAKNDYPPVDRDEVYKEIFEQAENFKKYHAA